MRPANPFANRTVPSPCFEIDQRSPIRRSSLSNARRIVIKSLIALLLWSASATQDRSETGSEQPSQGPSLTQLSLEHLGNVEVTSASKEPEEVWNTPAAIYVLTQDDIRRSGATTIPELLRLVPGVEVARIDSDHWAVGIRGFGSQFSKSVLVLIDGRSVYSPLFAGVYWQVQDTLLEDIERIEVIRGPGGTVWGANAVNGVLPLLLHSSACKRAFGADFCRGAKKRAPSF
jgi:iron complex outermembrane receptor protein